MAPRSRPFFHALLIASPGFPDQPEDERLLETSIGSKYCPAWPVQVETGLYLQQRFWAPPERVLFLVE